MRLILANKKNERLLVGLLFYSYFCTMINLILYQLLVNTKFRLCKAIFISTDILFYK